MDMYVSKHPSPCPILRLLALVSNHNLWLVVPIVSYQLGGLDRLSHETRSGGLENKDRDFIGAGERPAATAEEVAAERD